MRKGLLIRLLIVGAVLVAADQIIQHVALEDGELAGHWVAPFDPPVFSTDPAAEVERMGHALKTAEDSGRDGAEATLLFDAELGWCTPAGGGRGRFVYDERGARIGAGTLRPEKTEGVRRIVVFGGSMAHGDGLAAGESFTAQLDALRDDVEIANLGVSGYGFDQAVLRVRRDARAFDPDEVWLVWRPETTLRITTLFRPFVRHWSMDVGFKPRFAFDADGQLERIDSPARTPADVHALLSDQDFLLERLDGADPWVARARLAYAKRGSSLLHHSGFARVLLSWHEGQGRDIERHLAAGHSTRGLFRALVFDAGEVRFAYGARMRLLVIPGASDLGSERTGPRVWRDACATLSQQGIEVVDLFEPIWDAGGPSLYGPHGTLNAAGSRAVAEALDMVLEDSLAR